MTAADPALLARAANYTRQFDGSAATGGFMRSLHGWLLFPWQHSYSIGYYLVGAMSLVVLAQKLGIGSGLMATVVTTMPMWLALWSRLGGERVPVTSWLGLALGAAGAGVLALEGDFSATWLGTLCAFGAPLCWSIGSYASRKLSLPAPSMASGAQWFIGGAMGVLAGDWASLVSARLTGATLPFPFSETTGETTRDFHLVEMAKSVNGERDEHGESGGCEPPMPSRLLADRADHKRPRQTGEVHRKKVKLKPFDAPGERRHAHAHACKRAHAPGSRPAA